MKLYQVIGSVIAHIPCWSDMLRISTPMRPNRPHIPSFIINVKERGHKTNNTPELRASCLRASRFRYERFISLPVPSRLHRCVCSSSVRRYLGKASGGRKRKKHIRFLFSVTLNVYRGFSLSPPRLSAQCKAARAAKSANLANLPP